MNFFSILVKISVLFNQPHFWHINPTQSVLKGQLPDTLHSQEITLNVLQFFG